MEDVKRIEGQDEWGKPFVELDSPKFGSSFRIEKSRDSFAFFKIKATAGKTAKELEGAYTSISAAEKFLANYIKNAKKTRTVIRDEITEARKKSKENA